MPHCFFCKNQLTVADQKMSFCHYCFPKTRPVQPGGAGMLDEPTSATKEKLDKTFAVFQGASSGQIDTGRYPGYAVKGEIGRGGMGSVFLVRELTAKRDVALKTFSPFTSKKTAEQFQERFMEEALITAQLQHPGVIPIYSIARDEGGRSFYTMRPIEGEPLNRILARLKSGDKKAAKKYPLRRLVQIIVSVCQTMRFAHERGVIHRDLKPANIIVGDYGEVLVIWKNMGSGLDSVTVKRIYE